MTGRIRSAVVLVASALSAAAQTKTCVPPRASDGKADLQGIWQVRKTCVEGEKDLQHYVDSEGGGATKK